MNSSLPSGSVLNPAAHHHSLCTENFWTLTHNAPATEIHIATSVSMSLPPSYPDAMLLVLVGKPWKHGTDSLNLDTIWREPCRLGELWTFVQGILTPKGSASPPFLPFIWLEANFSFQGLGLSFRKNCFIESASLNARKKIEKRLSKFSLLLTKP